jgi:hypothetical protein
VCQNSCDNNPSTASQTDWLGLDYGTSRFIKKASVNDFNANPLQVWVSNSWQSSGSFSTSNKVQCNSVGSGIFECATTQAYRYLYVRTPTDPKVAVREVAAYAEVAGSVIDITKVGTVAQCAGEPFPTTAICSNAYDNSYSTLAQVKWLGLDYSMPLTFRKVEVPNANAHALEVWVSNNWQSSGSFSTSGKSKCSDLGGSMFECSVEARYLYVKPVSDPYVSTQEVSSYVCMGQWNSASKQCTGCPSGQFYNFWTRVCAVCTTPGCATCTSDIFSQCTSCVAGKTLNANKDCV